MEMKKGGMGKHYFHVPISPFYLFYFEITLQFFLKTPLNALPILYVKLMVIQAGHIPKRKKISATFLYQGRFAGIIGQLIPSPSNSLIPQTLIDSFI